MGADLLELADELYALSLPDFTPARDAKAKELKGTDLAKEVKALKKPSMAAWVVNLLVRHEAEQVEQLLQVGAALRAAQESMSGDELRQLTRQRRQVTAAVTTQARRLAREHGQKVTEAVAAQVEATLTAAMVDEECGKAVRSGMLLNALESTGVDAVDLDRAVALPDALGFVATTHEAAAPTKPDLHVVPDPDRDEKALAAAREALDEAEDELTEATSAYDEAAKELVRPGGPVDAGAGRDRRAEAQDRPARGDRRRGGRRDRRGRGGPRRGRGRRHRGHQGPRRRGQGGRQAGALTPREACGPPMLIRPALGAATRLPSV